MHAKIYFDGDCPFCARYAQLQRLRQSVDSLELINLREHPQDKKRLEQQGFELDDGMVLELDGRQFSGKEAARQLARLSDDTAWLGRAHKLVLGGSLTASVVYPVLRLGRNITLFLLGREPLARDTPAQSAWQTLVLMSWGLFAYLHVLVYAHQFGAEIWPSTLAIALLGVALFYFPLSRHVLAALLIAMVIDAARQMPSLSNHTILKNFFITTIVLSGTWHLINGGRWRDTLEDAAPVGRSLLAIMYVFGVFHKINTDFLNPETSCATSLWLQMPLGLSAITHPWMAWIAIFGTLVVETVILGCLLSTKTRVAGIAMGIAFHSFLALSGYAIYAPFSTLTIVLHLLFLDPQSAKRIIDSPFGKYVLTRLRTPTGVFASATWLLLLAALAWNQSYSQLGLLWLPAPIAICYALLRYGRSPDLSTEAETATRTFVSRRTWLNIIPLVFFASCLSPYFGLKTAQSMNMFANLRLESGVSNHLIFSHAPGPFKYLEDVVEITESTNSVYLDYIRRNDLHLTYYSLLDHLERVPEVTVSYIRNGELRTNQNAESLQQEIAAALHPRWLRNIFHFNPVDLRSPKPCALDR